MITFRLPTLASYYTVLSLCLVLHQVNSLIDAPAGKGMTEETKLDSGQYIVRKSMTQAESREYCETKGKARLAVLLKPEDATALVEAIKTVSTPYTTDPEERLVEFGMSRRYWIGLTDVSKEGEWVWMKEGSRLKYDNLWYSGQPDHGSKMGKETIEHCVVLWNPIFRDEKELHSFNDEPCMNKHYAICEDEK